MNTNDTEKIRGWNNMLKERDKSVIITEIVKKETGRTGKGKKTYSIWVNAKCNNGCEIKETSLTNLFKKERNVPCKCYSNRKSEVRKTIEEWCAEKGRYDIEFPNN